MEEVWKPVVGYEGLYEVSSLGSIKSYQNKRAVVILKQQVKRNGYKYVHLSKDKLITTKLAHRIVTEAFIGLSILQVNHKDGNKENNEINNLEYLSAKANMEHAVNTGLNKSKGEDNPAAKLKAKEVLEIRSLKNSGLSHKEIGKMFGISKPVVTGIINLKKWKHL